MVGIKYNSLADLNGQALAWCNKVNGRVHATATSQSPLASVSACGENCVRSLAPPSKITPASLGCDFVFTCAGYKKTASSHTPEISTPCRRSTSAKMWQSWPWITCWQHIMRGSRSLCTGYRIRGTMGPPRKRPSAFVGRGGRNGAGVVLAAGGDAAERTFFRRGCQSSALPKAYAEAKHRCGKCFAGAG